MEEMFLGEVIKKRRLELGLTQEELCEGICEPMTISRLENGRQTPSRNRINAILERLDLPADRYYALLSKNELELEDLQNRITSLNVQFQRGDRETRIRIWQEAQEAYQAMEDLMEKDDMISRQMILCSKAILGRSDGSRCSFEEKITILLDAIRLTVSSFDMDEIGKNLYTTNELKIINLIAVSYIEAGRHMDAIGILRQLYQYIQKHFQNVPASRTHFGMISYNYARELLIVGQYREAIEVAEVGRESCLKYGKYLSLTDLIGTLAECYYFLGENEKSRELYYQTYYLMKALGDEHNIKYVKADAKNYLNLEFEY